MKVEDIPEVDRALKKEFKAHSAPIIELIEAQTHDPFCVLVGTILSARTKDACTAGAVRRLFAKAKGACFAPEDLERLTAKEIEKLIFPVGFYHDKARHLKELPKVLKEKFGGVLPNTVEELCELPGVGRKTANLTVAVGFDLPAICVDVHVHRICNRLGLIKTKTPFDTEMALRKILPVKYWKTWNSHLVSFGQTRCAPVRPKCDGCPIFSFCTVPSKCEPKGAEVTVDGRLPKSIGLTKAQIKRAAEFFSAQSSARVGVPFRSVAVVLQDDASSAEVHLAVNGAEGPTDAITQGYDPMPGEEKGVYGEVYVNCDRALKAAPKRSSWSPAKELLLYVAHGIDHLSGADDFSPKDYQAMRRRELSWISALELDVSHRGTKTQSPGKSL
ncbi:MAG: rRNA maturation RNAse YbeY [Kiritimatiellae bacterium]|nr:rRNA maturation RNAse YbeY [Kiritimatiellia bacterium]